MNTTKKKDGFNNAVWQKTAAQVCRNAHGYTGVALSKQHYDGTESALTAYTVHDFEGDKVILARQFSDFFAFRIEIKGQFSMMKGHRVKNY